MYTSKVEPFEYDGGCVLPGETQHFKYSISETYLGDTIRIPVSVINGSKSGPTCFLTAASHGDELNGVEVVREVVEEWDHSDICGTIVGIPVMNVPGFLAQERYLPNSDRDLNRSFPGNPDGSDASRVAHEIYTNFIEPCDFGIDFHTSTRGRTNMFHTRANMEDEHVARLAKAFGSNVIIASEGPEGTLRREATDDGVQTLTIEMGQAHRFERPLIDEALAGVRSVFAEFDIYPAESVRNPIWRTIVEGWDERTWIRADVGGIVEMYHEKGDIIRKGETLCEIKGPFNRESNEVTAPFTGLLVGALENPVVSPGNPICHFVQLEPETVDIIEKERE